MRLDEQARRARLTQPAVTRAPAPALGAISVAPVVREVPDEAQREPAPPTTRGWARARWPLLTAVGTAW